MRAKPVTTPFAETTKAILRAPGRLGVRIGAEITGQPEVRPEGRIAQTVFGKEPIESFTTQTRRFPKRAEELGIPQQIGTPLAIPAVAAGALLDIYTGGGAEKQLVKQLTKLRNVDEVIDVLRGSGITDDVAKRYAPTIARSTQSGRVFAELEAAQRVSKLDPVVQRVQLAVKEAQPIQAKTPAFYQEERARRVAKLMAIGQKTSGERGFFSELGQLKGELPKPEFTSLRGNLKQEEIDTMFDLVKRNDELSPFETVNARMALVKLFGEGGGKIPTAGELELLRKTFGDDFVATIREKTPMLSRLKEAGLQLINLPRSVMASFDLSAPLRQGVFLVGKPKQWGGAFVDMFKAFGSEKYFDGIQQTIRKNPRYAQMERSGLSITDLGPSIGTREDQFMSNWAERIPLAGRVVRASGRAYVGFLNKLRADVFSDLAGKAETLGGQVDYDSIARFVNAASGRGSLGAFERAAPVLNGIFFSPRLLASRLQLLNPVFYARLDPFVRKEALKTVLTSAGAATTILGLAKMGGAEVEIDPRNANFAKIKVGNTRFDILGGFQQPIRLAAQLISGKIISSTTGREMVLGEGYRPLDRFDILQRFFENKESPVASFITGMLRGETSIGEPFRPTDEIAKRFIPMVMQDIKELHNENPDLIPYSPLALFGVGIQTYGPALTEEEKQYIETLPKGEQKNQKTILEQLKQRKAGQDIQRARRKETVERIHEELKGLSVEEANRRARELKATDPTAHTMLKELVEAERRGLTAFDKSIKQLGVENGERARFINDMMLKMDTREERNAYIEELTEKGVVTPEVRKQIKKLIRDTSR